MNRDEWLRRCDLAVEEISRNLRACQRQLHDIASQIKTMPPTIPPDPCFKQVCVWKRDQYNFFSIGCIGKLTASKSGPCCPYCGNRIETEE